MKAFISTIIILIVLVTGFFLNHNTLNKKTSIVQDGFENLKKALEDRDDERISSSYNDILSRWQKHSKYMLVFSNHSDLDNISVSLIKIKERIDSEDFSKAKEEIEVARSILKSIPYCETLKIENIF